jgi:hypothetical protein
MAANSTLSSACPSEVRCSKACARTRVARAEVELAVRGARERLGRLELLNLVRLAHERRQQPAHALDAALLELVPPAPVIIHFPAGRR